MIKNKYKTGDTFSIGNGVTAKVIEKIGTRYRLQFSNNIEGTFSERVVENNSFSNNILYTGATKDLGEGFYMRVAEVNTSGKLLCEYCKNGEVVTKGYLTRNCFDSLETLRLFQGGTIDYYNVKLHIRKIILNKTVNVCLCYEKFKTTTYVEYTGTELNWTQNNVYELFGNADKAYISKDGIATMGVSAYHLASWLRHVKTYSLNTRSLVPQKIWLTAKEYIDVVQRNRSYINKELSLGNEFYYEGHEVEIVAFPYDNDENVILRKNTKDSANVLEVSKNDLNNYFKKY